MGLITAKDIAAIPPPPTALQPSPLAQPQPQPFDMRELKEIFGMVNEGLRNVREIMEMRNRNMPQQNPQMQNANPMIEKMPASMAAPLPTTPQPQIAAPATSARINRQHLRALLADLITVQATKLPADIKNMPLGEIVGEKFASFEYLYMGIYPVKSDLILDTVTEKLGDAIDAMLKQG